MAFDTFASLEDKRLSNKEELSFVKECCINPQQKFNKSYKIYPSIYEAEYNDKKKDD